MAEVRAPSSAGLRLLEAPTRFLFFTGKGGVGKTSLACAVAVTLADRGSRVLLVSTDPASNLDEVLGLPLSGEPRAIPGVPGLDAFNIDPEAAAKAYRERVVGPMRSVLPAATVSRMEEELSGACTVEIAAFDRFARLLGDPASCRRLRPRDPRHGPDGSHAAPSRAPVRLGRVPANEPDRIELHRTAVRARRAANALRRGRFGAGGRRADLGRSRHAPREQRHRGGREDRRGAPRPSHRRPAARGEWSLPSGRGARRPRLRACPAGGLVPRGPPRRAARPAPRGDAPRRLRPRRSERPEEIRIRRSRSGRSRRPHRFRSSLPGGFRSLGPRRLDRGRGTRPRHGDGQGGCRQDHGRRGGCGRARTPWS